MTPSDPRVRIATRASRLALWQAEHVAALLQESHPGCDVQLIEVSTPGDRNQTAPLTQVGGQGVFTREVQNAVLDGRAEIAVHSLKDLPTESMGGLSLAGVPQRGSRWDVLVLPAKSTDLIHSLDELPLGARIGTGSPRRQAQLLHIREDLVPTEIRGNVETRLRKLDDGEYDAIVLAQAGLERLELAKDRTLWPLLPPIMLPAAGQAALGLECRVDDDATMALLASITDATTGAEVTAERTCLHELRAGCHAPVGFVTDVSGNELAIQGVVLSADGRLRITASVSGRVDSPEAAGQELAAALLQLGAGPLIAAS